MPSKTSSESAALGACLRRVRRSKELTQSELADLIGVSKTQVQKYEKGHNRIPADVIMRLSNLLSMPLRAFFPEVIDQGSCSDRDLDAAIRELFVGLEQDNKIIVADLLQKLRQALSA